jgi:uncharacterized protein YneR
MSTPQNSNFGHFLRSQPGKKTRVVTDAVTPQTSKSKGRRNIKAADQEPSPVNPLLETTAFIEEEVSEVSISEQIEIAEMSHPHITIETFSGKPGGRGDQWLKTYTNICKSFYNYNDEKVKATFPFHLTGQAKTWYRSLSDDVTNDADELIRQFKARFDGSDGGFSLGMVRQLPSESVHEYTTRFQNSMIGSDMPDKWIISTYVDGLIPSLRRIVKPQELSSLDAARRAALRAENSESDNVSVSAISASETDRKLDTLIELITHQMQMSLEHQQQAINQPQKPPRSQIRRQEATDFAEKGRNPYASRKQINHKCRICCETGHYEQNCSNSEEARKIYFNSKSNSNK